MIKVRPSLERGHANHGWLESYHTFSFAGYQDLEHMGFRSLRVINEDWVKPKEGFGMHPHKDMEIITYVLEGALEHKDSMGNGSVIRHGEIQVMSAGTGVTHSEFNHSKDETVHLMQIWILPEKRGIKPRYDQQKIDVDKKRGTLNLIVGHDGRDNSVKIHQDVDLYAAMLTKGDQITYELNEERYAWIQVAHGHIVLNSQHLKAGDGAAIGDENKLAIKAQESSEILLFDLA